MLERATDTCENFKKPAPFKSGTDGIPYLEVHHLVQLADMGDDTVENAIALRSTCHRFMHLRM
nr:HNH endonuclease [Burkholderia sola]